MESNQGNNDGVESFVVPEEQIVDNLDSEACLYSAEDRTLYDRCMLHKVKYEPAVDPRNESSKDRTIRHDIMRAKIKKKLGAERQRRRRRGLSNNAKLKQREKDANRQRARRASLTEDQRLLQRTKDAERQRLRRAALSPEERDSQRLKDKERQRKRRARISSSSKELDNEATSGAGSDSSKSMQDDLMTASELPLGSATVYHMHQKPGEDVSSGGINTLASNAVKIDQDNIDVESNRTKELLSVKNGPVDDEHINVQTVESSLKVDDVESENNGHVFL